MGLNHLFLILINLFILDLKNWILNQMVFWLAWIIYGKGWKMIRDIEVFWWFYYIWSLSSLGVNVFVRDLNISFCIIFRLIKIIIIIVIIPFVNLFCRIWSWFWIEEFFWNFLRIGRILGRIQKGVKFAYYLAKCRKCLMN